MENTNSVDTAVNRALAWIGMASSVVSLLDIIATVIVLKYFLTPTEYGTAMLAGTVFNMLDLATDMGMTTALIQRDDHTEERIATVFWINTILSIAIALSLVILGPRLGATQGATVIGTILIAYGGKLVFANSYSIPISLMKKELRFKELSVIRVLSNVGEAVGKIVAAALGASVWFYIIGRGLSAFITAIGAQLCRPWRPKFLFRFRKSKDYIYFGLKASGSQLLYQFYTNIDYQIVGWFFGRDAVGFYHLAYDIAIKPVRTISLVVIEIALPIYSKLKYDGQALVSRFLSFTRLNVILVVPVLVTIALCADDLIVIFWQPTYLPAVPAARIICVMGALVSMSYLIPPLLDGIGRPDQTLLYTIIASVTLPGSYFLCAHFLGERFGFVSVAIAWIIGYPVAFVSLLAITLRQINLELRKYMQCVAPVFACVAIAAIAGLCAKQVSTDFSASVRLGITATSTLGLTLLLFRAILGLRISDIRTALRRQSNDE